MDISDRILPLCVSQRARNLEMIDKHILELKEQRNSLLPVAKLPTEITTRIFFLLARREYSQRTKKKNWDWLALTRVCRAWRELALGCPILWAKIKPSFNMKRVEVFLQKSRQADLDIHLGGHKEHVRIPLDILQLISQHMSRVRELRLATSEVVAKDFIQNLIQGPMPRLRELHLFAGYWLANDVHSPTVQLNKLALFVPRVPLEGLSLCGVMMPWNCPLLRGLTELSLGNIDVHHRPTVGEILAVLENSPNLRLFKMSNIGPRLSGKCSKSVHLPRLKDVHITKIEYEALVELLKNLALPKDIGWVIEDVLNPFSESISFPDNLLNRSAVCEGLSLCLKDYSLSISPMFTNSVNDPRMSLILKDSDELTGSTEHGIVSFFRHLGKFFKHSFFSNVASLKFKFTYDEDFERLIFFTDAAWAHLFAALPELYRLEVYFPEVNAGMENQLVEALAGSTNECTEGSIICSKLQIIQISSAVFSGTRGRQALKKLLSNFVHRRENEKRLKYLKFDRCFGISAKDLQKMRVLEVAEVVEAPMDLEWDSATSRDSEESD